MAEVLLRDVYSNTSSTGFTINFFSLAAKGAQTAVLACPFFTNFEPIAHLTTAGCEVKLLVRLCDATDPKALKQALADPLVTTRYFTSRLFHAKFYVIDDVALVGSANLTGAGMTSNREVSVLLRRGEDAAFDELPGLFDDLFEQADHLDGPTVLAFEEALRLRPRSYADEEFEKVLVTLVPAADPESTVVGSGQRSKVRTFLQAFKSRYDIIGKALSELEGSFRADGRRRVEFADGELDIEISRFLGWVRIVHAPGEAWSMQEPLHRERRAAKIAGLLDRWHATSDITNGDMIYADRELANIQRIRENLATPASIEALTYDETFDTISGCHAFYELLRFTKGSIDGLRTQFGQINSLPAIKRNLTYLAHGRESLDPLVRAYDCLHDPKLKLRRFGESCVMELLGWVDEGRHPVNGRTIKALRYLGFDVN